MKFPFRISLVNGPNPKFPANSVTFTEKILNGKLLFLKGEYFTVTTNKITKMSFCQLKLATNQRFARPVTNKMKLSIYIIACHSFSYC